MLIDKIDDMIIGESTEENNQIKKYFTITPGITFENYFSGNNIIDYAGQKGFGLCTTVWRGRLPKGVPAPYMHKKTTEPGNQAARFTRFNEPIVMVQNVEDPESNK
eukprot:9070821-Ditylum_brightwellii.AAC.1